MIGITIDAQLTLGNTSAFALAYFLWIVYPQLIRRSPSAMRNKATCRCDDGTTRRYPCTTCVSVTNASCPVSHRQLIVYRAAHRIRGGF